MKAAYWIGGLALLAGALGTVVSRSLGWLEPGIGAVIGIGTLIYARSRAKA